jgi:hypothetical protein
MDKIPSVSKHGDVYGEWASRLTTKELQDAIYILFSIVTTYDRVDEELTAYKLRRLREELDKRGEESA